MRSDLKDGVTGCKIHCVASGRSTSTVAFYKGNNLTIRRPFRAIERHTVQEWNAYQDRIRNCIRGLAAGRAKGGEP